MQKLTINRALMLVTGAALVATASAQTDIARWSFDANSSTFSPNAEAPNATTDLTTAKAMSLGMINNYNGGNTAGSDFKFTGGDPNAVSTGYTWRIRGAGNNGWALAAPQYTQGAEFDVSTAGYAGISLSFDFYSTTQGIADLQVQYNTNVGNSSGWTNFQGSFAGNVATRKDSSGNTQLVATSNSYNTTGASVTTNTISFDANSIAGAANDANFGIRLVSAYGADGTYDSAAGGVYNNTSGNWRFDQIAIQGTAVPEPASFGLMAAGLVGLIARRKRA